MDDKLVLKVLYAKNKITESDLEVLKNDIPLRYKESENYKSDLVRGTFLIGRYITISDLKCKEEDIYYNRFGKPYCKNGIYFNVSHTSEYVVYVQSKAKIGIDIERIDKRLIDIIDYAYAEEEKEYIRSSDNIDDIMYRATLLWTMKESVFKASGIEIKLEPREIHTKDSGKLSFMGDIYNIMHVDFMGNIITTASSARYNEVKLEEVNINSIKNCI